jgi:hypothetical protein
MVQSRGYKDLNPMTNPVRRTDEQKYTRNKLGKRRATRTKVPTQGSNQRTETEQEQLAAGQQPADPHHGLQKKGITCEY